LVLAGAGSGKTRVITERIARLIRTGTRPESILAVSFTNKAARELQERVERLTGPDDAKLVWMSTFHSFGVRFLREESKALGYGSRFVIFDQGDCLGLIRDILRRERVGERRLDAGAVQSRISLWKNRFLRPDQVPESDYEYDAIAREVFPQYEEALEGMRAVDFDDLVVKPTRMLRDNEALRERWRNRFRHLLVDEFQDTNVSQLELVKLLTNQLRNVCVVGDDDQSIYGWRGAEVENIIDFDKTFPNTTVVKLEENYRSRAPILAVANAVMRGAKKKKHVKELGAARGAGERIQLCRVDDDILEARFVAQEMRRLAQDEGRAWASMSVLYRSNKLARAVEEELRVEGIPYRVFGGTQFYDRKEVKDALCYLRVALFPNDELALRRIINHPPRGIGATSLQLISRESERRGLPFGLIFRSMGSIPSVPNGAVEGARRLRNALDTATSAIQSRGSLAAIARRLVKDSGLERDIKNEERAIAKRKWENIEHLFRSLERYEKKHGPDASLGVFLERAMLRAEEAEEETGNRVTLSTLHASKGLEFDIVFLIGCVEGVLPHSRTTDPKLTEAAPTDVEEERRLFYVGVTRARDQLFLTLPTKRHIRGRAQPQAPSRFLEGLPEDAIEERNPDVSAGMDADELSQAAGDLIAQLLGG